MNIFDNVPYKTYVLNRTKECYVFLHSNFCLTSLTASSTAFFTAELSHLLIFTGSCKSERVSLVYVTRVLIKNSMKLEPNKRENLFTFSSFALTSFSLGGIVENWLNISCLVFLRIKKCKRHVRILVLLTCMQKPMTLQHMDWAWPYPRIAFTCSQH